MTRALIFVTSAVLAISVLPFHAKAILHTNRPLIHPALHLIAFATVAFLACAVARTRVRLVLALLATVAFGAFVEWLEAVIYNQKLEIADIRIDAYGAVCGCLFCILFLVTPFAKASSSHPQ